MKGIKMIQICICDDQKNTIENLENQLLTYAKEKSLDINIIYFSTPSTLYTYMQQNNPINIIFMDLEFGSQNEDGILWSKKIHKEFPQTLILILTAYEERYKEGYIARAFRFMTKPFEYEELCNNMDACLEELKFYKIILISSQGNTRKIPINEILYFEAQPGGSEIKTLHTTNYCDESLKQWELKTSSSIFFRCHKKYLVNLNAITKIKNHSILLSNGEEIPVSRRKWTLLKTAYIKFDIAMKVKE